MTPGACVIVANPHSGAGNVIAATRAVLTTLEIKVKGVLTLSRDAVFAHQLNDLVAKCSTPDFSRAPIVACVGGDGTLSAVLNLLESPERCVLAIVPCGSGNDVARGLGIPSIAAAIDVLRNGIEQPIDYGTVNERRFINCVGIGLDAEVARMAARIRGRGILHAASYYLAALRGLLTVKPVGASVWTPFADPSDFEDLVMLTIGNGRFYGGGFHGAPNAQLDDGMLDCYAFRDVRGLFKRFALMQRIKAGTHGDELNVKHIKTPRLGLRLARTVAMHVDGEITETARAEVSTVARGTRVLVPSRPNVQVDQPSK
jgi:YegS/Rv2252/BmrU family lipid kinase